MRLGDLDALKDEMSKVFFNNNDDMIRIEKLIDNAPTVSFAISPDYVTELQNLNKELIKQIDELERPQGEWIVEKNQFGDILYCSRCGVRPRRSEYGTYLHDKFCNNCGADMRGEAK